ncbi:MAG: MFS transporter [Paracoccaceae bacterium]
MEKFGQGFSYIWGQKVVLGAITLDLFAVILGGATALLPIFAQDILNVGSSGLGVLRSAPALGAIVGSLILIRFPITNHAGKIIFAGVFGFGLCIIVFALSPSMTLSLTALVLAGSCDTISVYVRAVLIQLWTPDDLRVRANAINQLCVGGSNEIGAFQAGTLAAFITPTATVLIGGIGAIAVASLWWSGFSQLRQINTLKGPQE